MKVLKVGTDFSGIGSPEEALTELKNEGFLDFESEFACEIDKYARLSHQKLHDSKVMYEDITKRNHSEVPQLDLYVAGFPCQAFSIAGKQLGFEDVRGTLFFNVADFIRENQPKAFILENVKGLVSHDSGRTFQTIIDLLSNGGGTVNGQMSLDFFDDGLGYHIHYKVLNTKEHGIPQNRERIFIVGFKDSRDYGFPVKEPLKLRLKDLLQDSTSDKYYLSDKRVKTLIDNPRSIGFKDPDNYKVANCVISGYNKLPSDGLYLKVKPKKVDDKYYLSDKMIEKITFSKKGNGEVANLNKGGERGSVYSEDCRIMTCLTATDYKQPKQILVKSNTKKGLEEAKEGDSINYSIPTSKTRRGRVGKQVAQTLDTACNMGVIVHNITQKVNVRKYEVDLKGLKNLLSNKNGFTIKEISDKLNVNKSTVEHWFRKDKHFSIPDADIWFELKKLLDIKTDDFDKSIITFEEKDNVFEKENRVYDIQGISPTLTTVKADEKITDGARIRRLTPLECWRLQGFSDQSFYKAEKVNSDTQLYKQAGNSITVDVIKKIIKNIYK
jgi:DNA-cytosine methyltransferase